MTTNPTPDRAHRAVLTVTVETRPDGGHYFDQADFAAHAAGWVRSALRGKHAVGGVTVDEQAAVSVVPPATNQTGLRDRIAAVIWERQNPGRRYADCEYRWKADAEADADAVLAVLPAPVDRAATLREAADELDAHATQLEGVSDDPAAPVAKVGIRAATEWRVAAALLRRRAAEAQPAKPDRCPHGCDTSTCPCLACEADAAAEAPHTETPDEAPPREPHPTEADLHHALAVLDRFQGRDTVAPAVPETVHACPPDGSGLTPCCGRTPFELPRTDRMSSEAAAVTCAPAVVAQPGKEQPRIPCNAVHLRVHHAPHGWEPQPGMDRIPCPGYPTATS